MKTYYIYDKKATLDEAILDAARSHLGVFTNANGDEIKNAYLNRLPESCNSKKSNFTFQDVIEIDALNRSLESLVTFGNITEANFPRFKRTIRISDNGSVEHIPNNKPPHFSYDCWNPEIIPFSSFVHNYISETNKFVKGTDKPVVGWHKGLEKYFLPYYCLRKLISLAPSTPYSQMDEKVEIELLRPSLKGRSDNIETMTIGAPLKYRIMKEKDLYPFDIEILSDDEKSLGELPRDFCACLTALLKKNLIEITATVSGIDYKENRGKLTKCSYISISLHIKTTGKPIVEYYF